MIQNLDKLGKAILGLWSQWSNIYSEINNFQVYRPSPLRGSSERPKISTKHVKQACVWFWGQFGRRRNNFTTGQERWRANNAPNTPTLQGKEVGHQCHYGHHTKMEEVTKYLHQVKNWKKKVNPDSINTLPPAQLKTSTHEKSLDNCSWEITNHMTHKDCTKF